MYHLLTVFNTYSNKLLTLVCLIQVLKTKQLLYMSNASIILLSALSEHYSVPDVMKYLLSRQCHADSLSRNNAHKPMLLSAYYKRLAFGTCPLFVRLTHLHGQMSKYVSVKAL